MSGTPTPSGPEGGDRPRVVGASPSRPEQAGATDPRAGAPDRSGTPDPDADGEALAGDAAPRERETSARVRARHTPRYTRFIVIGMVLCVFVAGVLTYSFPQSGGTSRNAVFGYMALVGIAVGATLGSVVALLLDVVSRRRARIVEATRIEGVAAEAPEAVDPVEGGAAKPDSERAATDRPEPEGPEPEGDGPAAGDR